MAHKSKLAPWADLTPRWFDSPHEIDCPRGLQPSGKKSRICNVAFQNPDSNGRLQLRVKLELDSQQPCVVLSVLDSTSKNDGRPSGNLVFAAQDNFMELGIEKDGDPLAETIGQLKREHPLWVDNLGPTVAMIELTPDKSVVQTGQPWLLEGEDAQTWHELCRGVGRSERTYIWLMYRSGWEDLEKVFAWMRVLRDKVHSLPEETQAAQLPPQPMESQVKAEIDDTLVEAEHAAVIADWEELEREREKLDVQQEKLDIQQEKVDIQQEKLDIQQEIVDIQQAKLDIKQQLLEIRLKSLENKEKIAEIERRLGRRGKRSVKEQEEKDSSSKRARLN